MVCQGSDFTFLLAQMSVAAAAVEMPAGAGQRVEALPEALLATLGHLVDDPKSLARAGAVGRAWRVVDQV